MTAERVLMVGPYAPYRDGIGAYLLQQVVKLRAEGAHVEVLSPLPSAAHHHLDLTDPRAVLKLPGIARGFDRVIMHFHPDYYFADPAAPFDRIVQGFALGRALRSGPPATLVVHEIDASWAAGRRPASVAIAYLLGAFDRLNVHYGGQRDVLVEGFGIDPVRVDVIPHGSHFRAHVADDRAAARRSLGLDPTAHVSLCIGFIAEHKGFDRAVRAFARVQRGAQAAGGFDRPAELHIVGAASTGNDAAAAYADRLVDQCAETPGAILHRGFVSDATFDRWIVAADLVVLPYRFIWSSSVVERALMFGRDVLATRVGGLTEQLADVATARLVDSDRELASAYAASLRDAGVISDDSAAATTEPWDDRAGYSGILAEVRRRADRERGYAFREPSMSRRDGRGGADTVVDRGSSLARLRRLGPYVRPQPHSARPGVAPVKKIQQRLLNWEILPLIGWVDELRRATQEALESPRSLDGGGMEAAAVGTVTDQTTGESVDGPAVDHPTTT